MTNDRIVLLDALLRQQLSPFTQKAFHTISPADKLLWNWHLDVIADHLERCARGEIKRLIITVPPRSMKSIYASVALPAWILGRDPTQKIVCSSYSTELAGKMARDCRSVMETVWYRRVFPLTRLKRSAELDLVTTQQGGRYSASVGGTLTGRGGNIIIIDDPMKPQDAMSETIRKNVKQWYDNTLYTRLDDKREGVIILVMQRLHVDDMVAHVLEKEEWVHLNLPAIAEVDEEFILSNGRRFVRSAGDILHPEREPLRILENTRQTIGVMNFSAQYQQQPIPVEGNIVHWSWFERYDEQPTMKAGSRIVQSWDTAITTKEMSDYSVCTTWLIQDGKYYLIDVFRKKLEFPELRSAVISHKRKFNARTILIENTASGIGLIQQLHRDASGLSIIKVNPDKDKVTRIQTASVEIEASKVYLPNKAPWLEEFQKELLAFPGGTHDDQVDSVSQFLNWNIRPRSMHVGILRGF